MLQNWQQRQTQLFHCRIDVTEIDKCKQRNALDRLSKSENSTIYKNKQIKPEANTIL